MQEVDARAELNKLKAQGIIPKDKESFDKMKHRIGVIVEVLLPEDSQAKALDFNIDVLGNRGVAVTLSDFDIDRENGQRTIKFYASMQIPKNLDLTYLNKQEAFVTSFTDFCWYAGNENVDPTHTPEVETLLTPGVIYADLGWQLPCRFADRLLDALGIANDWLFEGVLQDAIIYGVYIR